MRHRRLFTLLASLNRAEFKRFGKFLASPYFTESEAMVIFHEHLKRHHPEFDEKKMQLEVAFARLFADRLNPKEGEVKKRKMLIEKLDHLLSNMFRLLETFLVVEEALFDPEKMEGRKPGKEAPVQLQARQSGIPLREELLAKSLGRYTDYEHFLQYTRAMIEKTEKLSVPNSGDYLFLSELNHWWYYHPDTNKLQRNAPDIWVAMLHLDRFFVLSKLRYMAEWLSRQEIKPDTARTAFSDEVLAEAAAMVAEDKGEKHPLIAIYLELVRLYREVDGNEQRFATAGVLFMQHVHHLPFAEKCQLFTHLSNFGVRLYSLENQSVGLQLLALYQWALGEGLLATNQRMTVNSYLNVSLLAVGCGELDWAEKFIFDWKNYLEENLSAAAFMAASSSLHFANGDFGLAHACLTGISENKPPFGFFFRELLLKIYFEQLLKDRGKWENLSSHIAAFEKFILSQHTGAKKQTAWMNFIRFARKLAALWMRKGKVAEAGKQRLKAKMEAEKYVVSKRWLLKKLDDL